MPFSKHLSLILAFFVFVAFLVPGLSATLTWDPASYLDIDAQQPRAWTRSAANPKVVRIDSIPDDIDYPSDKDEMVNNKIKVSPIGMFSYLIRMAEASKRSKKYSLFYSN